MMEGLWIMRPASNNNSRFVQSDREIPRYESVIVKTQQITDKFHNVKSRTNCVSCRLIYSLCAGRLASGTYSLMHYAKIFKKLVETSHDRGTTSPSTSLAIVAASTNGSAKEMKQAIWRRMTNLCASMSENSSSCAVKFPGQHATLPPE